MGAMKVFLSHGRSEPALLFAKTLASCVEQAGFEASLPEARLPATPDVQATLKQQLEESDAYLFVVDPQSTRSVYVQRQWQAAVEHSWAHPEKPMIPVLVGDAQLPAFLTDRKPVQVAEGEPPEKAAMLAV